MFISEGWGDEAAMMGDSDGEGEEETEEDIKRKIAEIERRKWINENSQMLEASEEESQKMLFENSKFLKLGKTTKKKIESFVESSSSSFVINEVSSGGIAEFSIAALVKSKIQTTPKNILAFKNNSNKDTEIDQDEEDSIKLTRTSTSQPMFASPDEPSSKVLA